MKIAIVGSHGVGKTTLFNKLELEGVEFIQETARELMGYMDHSTADMDDKEKGFFQQVALNHQIWREVEHERFIADRCVLDYLAYSHGLPFYDKLKDQVDFHLERHGGYDQIFFIPIEFPLEVDGLRFTDDKYQKEIDERLLGLIQEYGIPYEIITGDVEERLEKILNELKWKQNVR